MLMRFFLVLCDLPLLTACAGMSLGALVVSSVAVAGITVAAVAADKDAPLQTEVHGTYEHGFWFDRDLFSVWVISDSPEESKRVAQDTATNSCAQRSKTLKVIETWDWQVRQLFIPIKVNRFSSEMKFRCEIDSVEKP